LVEEFLYAREGGSGGDAVDQHKALAFPDPLISQSRVFFLSRRIEHFEHARLGINDHLLSVRVFDGGVVRFDEVV
jgi:hypothetical protein